MTTIKWSLILAAQDNLFFSRQWTCGDTGVTASFPAISLDSLALHTNVWRLLSLLTISVSSLSFAPRRPDVYVFLTAHFTARRDILYFVNLQLFVHYK